MKRHLLLFLFWFALLTDAQYVWAQTQRVVDIPTRPRVTQRLVLLTPDHPKAAVILLAGGHGGLQIFPNGSLKWGEGNFLVRSRRAFAQRGLTVAVVDAPSDRQNPPYLNGFRQTSAHVADIKAVIAWLRQQADIPVWLIGTSRGTQSAAYIATKLPRTDGGPDGVVLTSTVLSDDKGRPVPDMDLGSIGVPVLVAHHHRDGCEHCRYGDLPRLMNKLPAVRKELLSFDGGSSRGDPCEAFAYHGFNGIEPEVIDKIAAWMIPK